MNNSKIITSCRLERSVDTIIEGKMNLFEDQLDAECTSLTLNHFILSQ